MESFSSKCVWTRQPPQIKSHRRWVSPIRFFNWENRGVLQEWRWFLYRPIRGLATQTHPAELLPGLLGVHPFGQSPTQPPWADQTTIKEDSLPADSLILWFFHTKDEMTTNKSSCFQVSEAVVSIPTSHHLTDFLQSDFTGWVSRNVHQPLPKQLQW